MTTIVISYRRGDSGWIADRIFDRLENHYGKGNVFMDIDSIPFGLDFRHHIRETLDHCDVMVALVGPNWIGKDQSGDHILEETDWVRIEIEAALQKRIPLIPLLIDGSKMPRPGELPDSVRDFAFRNAAGVDRENFRLQIDKVIASIDQHLVRAKQAPSTERAVSGVIAEAEPRRGEPRQGAEQGEPGRPEVAAEPEPARKDQAALHQAETEPSADLLRKSDETSARAEKDERRLTHELETAFDLPQQRAFAAAKAADTIKMMDAFLSTYPEGRLAEQAKALRATLIERDNAYKEAMSSDDPKALRGFLDHYPSGKQTNQVRQRLVQLQPASSSAGRIWSIFFGVIVFVFFLIAILVYRAGTY